MNRVTTDGSGDVASVVLSERETTDCELVAIDVRKNRECALR